ncbi:MAG: M43 family zinc metalloprotease [Bacteroidota bacterium]
MPRFFALLALVFASSAAAQPGRQCATPRPTTAHMLQTADIVQRFQVARASSSESRRFGNQPTVVPVAVHVIASGPSEADGNLPTTQIEAQMDVLNAAFQPHGFRFVLASISRTINATWATGMSANSANERAMKQALSEDTARFMNVYITDAAGDLLGWATLPFSQSETSFADGVVLDRETLPGGSFAPFNEGDTGTHEVGHWLGLYHTFNEDAPAGNPCGGSGDLVSDTPVEASPASGCPVGRDTCPALPGLDPITNFMDYSDDACMVEFSAGQADRMQALTASFRPTIAAGVAPLAAPDELVFGQVFVDITVRRMVRIVNPSQTPLVISSITSSNAAFVPSEAALTVGSGESTELEVAFTPTDAIAYNTTLTLATGGTPLTVDLRGVGRFVPELEVPTPAIARALDTDQTDTATLTLTNAGLGALEYEFVGRSAGREAPSSSSVASWRVPTLKEGGRVAAARRGDGGPDAFGTTWVDSDEATGPAYAWVDISASGTAHTLADDGTVEVELPFAFPFYGTSQDRVWINANGFLTFDGNPGGESFRNLALPSADAPSIIAPYWDDLDPSSGGRVFSQDLGDGRFVVTWEDVPHYSESGDPGSFRFQVLLESTGSIVFQYAAINAGSYAASSTVGIQPSDGSAGLQVAYNAIYARNELAVRFSPRATWIRTITPSSGTIAPNGEQVVSLGLDATGLAPGAYQDLVALATNDPFRPETRVHVVLGVGNALVPPALADPAYGQTGTTARLRLDWLDAAAEYEVQVARDEAFADLVFTDVIASSQLVFAGETETGYWWRVRSVSGTETSDWSLAFPFTTGTEPGDIELEPIAFRMDAPFPNPAEDAIRVPFTLAEDGSVRANVFDAAGRLVLSAESGVTYRSGIRNTLRIDVATLPPGLYVVRLVAGSEGASRRLVVVR